MLTGAGAKRFNRLEDPTTCKGGALRLQLDVSRSRDKPRTRRQRVVRANLELLHDVPRQPMRVGNAADPRDGATAGSRPLFPKPIRGDLLVDEDVEVRIPSLRDLHDADERHRP